MTPTRVTSVDPPKYHWLALKSEAETRTYSKTQDIRLFMLREFSNKLIIHTITSIYF